MKLNFLVIALFFLLSCEKDPIFGLERGWLLQGEEEEQEDKQELAIQIISPEEGDVWVIGNTGDGYGNTYLISFSVNENNYSGQVGIALINNSNNDYIASVIQNNTGYSSVRLEQSDPPGSYEVFVYLADEYDPISDAVNITIVE